MEKTKKNYNKSHTGLIVTITIIVLIVLMVGTWLTMAYAFPRTLANFTYSLNMTKYTRTLYLRDYDKSKDVNSIYMATNLSIKLKDYASIEDSYVELSNHKDYEALVNQVNEDNSKLDIDSLTLSTLLNEDEYLKNNYVLALVNLNKWQVAFEYACNDFEGVVPTADSTGNYLFGNIVSYMPLGGADAFEGQVLADINAYFDNMYNILTTEFDVSKEPQMFALCNKMMKVGNNLVSINKALGKESLNDAVQSRLAEVNSALSSLLGD